MIITNEIKEARQISGGLAAWQFSLVVSIQLGQSDTDILGFWLGDDEQPAPARIPVGIDAGLEGHVATALIGTVEHFADGQDFIFIIQILEGTIRAFGIQSLIAENFLNNKGFLFAIAVDQLDLFADAELGEGFAG